ncbi:molecular chaperone [Candidatus Scalindua japonica]|uniref:Molecular chaperone n=1 Tax=Candidatus Scalindua japonica TaxID=1284222 RepID=A0A286U3J1_9BACT|nr:Hsp70 family protein [Candidatus Scalindua japonica]GAX62686.1 molecular chaperone [Candidatus Scalindua japonica]
MESDVSDELIEVVEDEPTEIEETKYKYIVGIDLGTTNSAVSYVDLTIKDSEKNKIRFLDIPQLVAPGEIGQRSVLPSFLYLPGPYDMPEGSTSLPWDTERKYAVGEIAREQGAVVPGRLVSSAKSWLCHGRVDRTAKILPWGEGTDVEKVSPVEASSRYIQHIREVWDETMARGREGHGLEEQMVYLTVPASFDEVARELTVKASGQAGLKYIKLMEEPLAAFYAWLYQHEKDWQNIMKPGQLIIVCDVGGGTTDFTIIAVVEGENGLCFNRLSVGEHLMLGGDNMDMTIARNVEAQLCGRPGQLDSNRWHELTHQCRKVKEGLLSEKHDKQEMDIAIMGTGGKLIASTLKTPISTSQVEELIIEGFFPFVSFEEKQESGSRKGLMEWGLPYVQEPAITKHLAAFWQRSVPILEEETGRTNPFPDFLLFNGGSLTPAIIRNRIRDAVQKWFHDVAGKEWSPRELHNPKPELAVAVGAANYGIARTFDGIKVGAGSPRTYYVEVSHSQGEEKGDKSRKAVCLVPRSSEEGFDSQLRKPEFEVLTNKPVAFTVFSSNTRIGDKMGDIVMLSEEEITLLPPINTVLKYGKKKEVIPLPIHLEVRLTEIGTLELWCNSQKTTHRWQLQFDVRLGGTPPAQSSLSTETLDSETIELAIKEIQKVFEKERSGNPESLLKNMTSIMELDKTKWSMPVIRKMADTLFKFKQGRSFSPQHEARWLNLLGFCLRPGFGDPLDDWRTKGIWKIFLEGLSFSDKHQCRTEWRILWRRVAGGLKAGQQLEVYEQLFPSLPLGETKSKKKKYHKTPKGKMLSHEGQEIWMALANLERLPVDIKETLGRQLLERFSGEKLNPKELWALSRLGARIPFHGPLDKVVSAQEVSTWLNKLLSSNPEASNALAHALVQLGRSTGDRGRDLPDNDKGNIIKWLDNVPNGDQYKELINNPESALGKSEQEWIFGEALPPGLVISSEE